MLPWVSAQVRGQRMLRASLNELMFPCKSLGVSRGWNDVGMGVAGCVGGQMRLA